MKQGIYSLMFMDDFVLLGIVNVHEAEALPLALRINETAFSQ